MNAIETKDLHYKYPDGTVGLKEIDFCAAENETVAVIGPNGAGKTTLLMALCGLVEFKGTITIFGKNLNKKDAAQLRRYIGFLFQDPDDQLFMPTVYEDVAFGPGNLGCAKEELPKIVGNALASVELQGFEDRASHHLSFGERKRVSLAAVIAMKPKILLFDEPTSNLDPRSRREFIELVQDIRSTKIIVGHDIDMIRKLCSRVVLVNHSSIIAEGPADEILDDIKLMKENGLF